MEMIKVKTTGNFMLTDPQTGHEMVADEVREVPKTHFVIERLELGQLSDEGSAGEKVESTTGEERTEDTPPGETDVKLPGQEAGEPADADADGHDDKTGEFVEDNKAARKPRGKK